MSDERCAPSQAIRPAARAPADALQALFIHGMGRTPLSGWRMLRTLQANGIATGTFAYSTALQDFEQISRRLSERIQMLAARGDYILIGHSLGGVLLRSALASLPAATRQPLRVFLLGSPTRAARLARMLERNVVFRIATGDCGQLLASDDRMGALSPVAAPTTRICGDRGIALTSRCFGGEPNDGVVACAETSAPWINETVLMPVVHTFLPSSAQVARIILLCTSEDAAR
ncbi:lipase family protein [Uliginosibacterium sp. TH139]|uniref:lipase family alpha/beta hydrolase n=1 Tax=Uliginosibacterium sp. TH139 TaxID=2067453 RepID=UPI001C1F311A|nr:lipase family protein [Uliginosibacterium sp. TH139]